jgi:hypothetical protein
MVNPNRFYTYAYLREDRTPYYIGKGAGDRVYYKKKNEVKPPKDKSRIIFLKQNLTEEEAFKHEIYMIVVFGRKDLGTGILRNLTDGGEGVSGVVISEETRKKMCVANKIKNKGKKWWNGGCEKSKRSVECPGEGWVLGKSKEHKRKNGEANKGKKWWNDGCGNVIRSIECPGEGWVLGRSEEHKKNLSLSHKNIHKETREKQSKAKKNVKWWNDGCGNTKFCLECPGDGWRLGRGHFKNRHKST